MVSVRSTSPGLGSKTLVKESRSLKLKTFLPQISVRPLIDSTSEIKNASTTSVFTLLTIRDLNQSRLNLNFGSKRSWIWS